MSRSKINLFPKHHIPGMLGLANVRQHIPQICWKIPGRSIYQGSGYRVCQTPRSGTVPAWDVTWYQGNVIAHRHQRGEDQGFSDDLPPLEATPEGKLPLTVYIPWRGLHSSQPGHQFQETLDCWGFTHCREKSSPRIPEHSEHPYFGRKGAGTPSSKLRDLMSATAPTMTPGFHTYNAKNILRSLSPAMCQLDPSMYLLQGQLFHWEHCFYFPVFQKELPTQYFPLPS